MNRKTDAVMRLRLGVRLERNVNQVTTLQSVGFIVIVLNRARVSSNLGPKYSKNVVL